MRHRLPLACLLAAALTAALAGCDDEPKPPAPWLLDPTVEMPQWLSEAGIYRDLRAFEPADGFIAYTPPHALFSNRADKARLLWLPTGERVDTTGATWVFPVGTVLVKTFGYRHVEGRYGEVAIETRVMRHEPEGWRYAVYHWGTDGRDALRLDGRWPEQPFVLEDLNGADFAYVIPGELDCEACHDTHRAAPVIGIDPDNLDPALVEAGVFDAPPEVIEHPYRTDEERRAMSYLVGNCVHCHHGEPRGDNASFSLRPRDLVANTVNVPTDSSASGDGIRVVPGDPEGSALYEAVVSARAPGYAGEFKAMPPVGIVNGDHRAEEILRRWIESL